MEKKKNKLLTLEQRRQIQGLLHSNITHKKIAELIGIHHTTLYREFKKCKDVYIAEEAHKNTNRGYHSIDYSIIGKKFGLLTVVDYVHKYNHRTYWKCKCDCGRFTIIIEENYQIIAVQIVLIVAVVLLRKVKEKLEN